MRSMQKLAAGGFLSIVMAFANLAWAAPQYTTGQEAPAPDNTKVNKRDRNKAEATADQQKENSSDRGMAQQIRRAITNDKSLSSYAHNVKIIVQGGAVTLKGPVRSDEEKKAIEAKANELAGEGKVTSQLEVKPSNK